MLIEISASVMFPETSNHGMHSVRYKGIAAAPAATRWPGEGTVRRHGLLFVSGDWAASV